MQEETKPEVKDSVVEPTRQEWEVAKVFEIRAQYEQIFKGWKAEELEKLKQEQNGLIQEASKKYFEEWKASQKPPNFEDIQRLLEQEYVSINIKVRTYDEEGNDAYENFVITELPQEVEEKFYKMLKKRLWDKAAVLAKFEQEHLDASFEDQFKAVLELIDESFPVLAETVVLILNPFGKKKHIDVDWVKKNIASQRQWSMIEAQIHVNRLRDFFSRVSQVGLLMKPTTSSPEFLPLPQQPQ